MNDQKPTYDIWVPSKVLHDNRLNSDQKMLYGELKILAYKYGYCWPTNRYLAHLYDVHKDTMGRWIKGLEKLGYIRIELIMDGKQIIERRIYILDLSSSEQGEVESPDPKTIASKEYIDTSTDDFQVPPTDGNTEDNNIKENTTSKNNKKEYIRKNGMVPRPKQEWGCDVEFYPSLYQDSS